MADDNLDPESDLSTLRRQTIRMAGDLGGSLRRISLRQGETEATVEWAERGTATGSGEPEPVVPPAPPEPEQVPDGRLLLTSPMVGTFYRAPRPDAEVFVEVGQVLEKGQPIGVVEAMKLFNPIVADSAGTIVEILVGNAEAVEFGQPLVALIAADEIVEG